MELWPTLKLGWFNLCCLCKGGIAMPNRVDNTSSSGATLLEQLLALMRRGGVHSIAEVAAELETSPVLVETMLEDLSQRGYLHPVEAQCAQECKGCALSGQCAVTGGGRVWQIEP